MALAGGMAYVGLIAGVPLLLAQLGGDAEEIFADAGVDLSLCEHRHNQISALAVERLLLLCAERTMCPHFGLLVGQLANLASLGPLGTLMRVSDTLGDALRRLEQHLQIRTRGGLVQLEVDDGFAVLRYCPYYSTGEGAGLVCEGVLVATTQVVRELCGPAWVPTEVLVPRRAHGNPEPYRSAFRAPVRFNQEMGALVFPAALLEQPLPYADPITRQNLEQHILDIEQAYPHDAADELRRQLCTELLKAKCSAQTAARRLSIHRRTLNRRLSSERTGFKAIADEMRAALARQLLADTELSLAHIAAALDFSEAAAFTHAFRRWSGGVPPSVWRAQSPKDPGRHTGLPQN
jgi:AraC-like DNA-binding protein